MLLQNVTAKELIKCCEDDFLNTALEVYHYQVQYNDLYKTYNEILKIDTRKIKSLEKIPFLPISFFKSHQVLCKPIKKTSTVFESSGTSGLQSSKHYVYDINFYNEIALNGFNSFYGDIENSVFLALLPSYVERSGSSLVHMLQMFMQVSNTSENGFYLYNFDALHKALQLLKKQNRKVYLFGVTFALIDFAEQYPSALENIIVIETGGMKGRKEEWTREQVHSFLKERFNIPNIHSEYGMTELLSQAYALKDGIFKNSPTLKTLIRDISDPLETKLNGRGNINIIDLANIHSCAFIATEDVGEVYTDGSFKILGRTDFSALRGCSLLAI